MRCSDLPQEQDLRRGESLRAQSQRSAREAHKRPSLGLRAVQSARYKKLLEQWSRLYEATRAFLPSRSIAPYGSTDRHADLSYPSCPVAPPFLPFFSSSTIPFNSTEKTNKRKRKKDALFIPFTGHLSCFGQELRSHYGQNFERVKPYFEASAAFRSASERVQARDTGGIGRETEGESKGSQRGDRETRRKPIVVERREAFQPVFWGIGRPESRLWFEGSGIPEGSGSGIPRWWSGSSVLRPPSTARPRLSSGTSRGCWPMGRTRPMPLSSLPLHPRNSK